ncbi:MAG: hypothetical protein HY455_00320 [Parcubacteria group bacterium]|nr:hypothetical protein [Parcubacteria group bacterium]
MEVLRWALVGLGIIFAVWYFGGGQGRSSSFSGPFLNPPAPISTGDAYGPSGSDFFYSGNTNTGNTGSQTQEKPPYIQEVIKILREKGETEETINGATKTSIFGDRVSFENAYNTRETDPQKEYILIRASYQNAEPIIITGWQIKSLLTGNSVVIGSGTYLPDQYTITTAQAIALSPGGAAALVTGRSPLGASFRSNICTGYYEYLQDFVPPLPIECPLPEDDFQYAGTTSDGQCLDYLESLNQCQPHLQAIPLSLTNNARCQEFISQYVNYSGCVSLHKNEPGFYKNGWRIYFSRGQELWRDKREVLVLYDREGRIVDSITP